jgi:hypothetical protein
MHLALPFELGLRLQSASFVVRAGFRATRHVYPRNCAHNLNASFESGICLARQ